MMLLGFFLFLFLVGVDRNSDKIYFSFFFC